MARTKVSVKLDFMKDLKQFVNDQFAEDVGDATIMGILEATKVGLSPVKGIGRFVGYKAQEEAKKLKQVATHLSKANMKSQASSMRSKAKTTSSRGYPFSVQSRFPGKKVRPVNLSLTGTMLESIEAIYNKRKGSVTIGIFKGKSKLIAETHNLGTQEPRVPTRQFLPTTQGQEFVESIMRGIKEIYRKRLTVIIEMSKRRSAG